MAKIQLSDSTAEVVVKMAEGKPGAVRAIMEMMKEGAAIDPRCFMGGLGAVLLLDTLEIYGTEIYILWNDQCNRDVRELLMLLRANQLGFVSASEIKAVAADQIGEVVFTQEKMDEFDKQVCERLDGFRRRKEPVATEISK